MLMTNYYFGLSLLFWVFGIGLCHSPIRVYKYVFCEGFIWLEKSKEKEYSHLRKKKNREKRKR